MLQSCIHIHIFAHGYSRWKPIKPEDMEILTMPGILLPDINSEEMPMDTVDFISGLFDAGSHGCCPCGSEVEEDNDPVVVRTG